MLWYSQIGDICGKDTDMEEKKTKYQELVEYVYNLIENGTLKDGDKLYSENELCEMFQISRQTVRKAIGILEEEGRVRRIRGSGTYLSRDYGKASAPKSAQDPSKTRIAVVTTYVESYIFPKTIQGIEKVLSEEGYSVQIAFTNNTTEREKEVLQDIINRDDVAGVIVEGTKSGLPNPNRNLYHQLAGRHLPLLFINTYYPEVKAPHVSLNDVKAAEKAVDYLIQMGHQNIGTIMKLDDGQGRLRYLGYLLAMEAAGLKVSDSQMVWIDTDESKQLAFCMDKIVSRLENCTAVLCYNDQIAFQLIKLLQERGIAVPQQMSVISIDDSDLALHSEVPITSLPHPKEKLGIKAAECLLHMIRGKETEVTYEFDTRVVERDSVKRIK